MNKTIRALTLFFLAFACVAWFTGCMSDGKVSLERWGAIVDKQGKPTQLLAQLLDLLGVEHNSTLESIVDATQKAWLRRPGTERWDMQEKYEDKREQVLDLLTKIGSVNAIEPSQKTYDRVIVLGALASRIRSRFAYALELWNRGVRFDELVFLVGQRPLHPKLESQEIILDAQNKELPFRFDWVFDGNLPKTEAEAARIIIDQAPIPAELKEKVKIIVVDTPMQRCSDGSIGRPNTGDTFLEWMKRKPQPGSCLVVSNQPYVGYQDSVARTYAPEGFTIETVGPQLHHDLPIVVHLDNLTRWLYQERKRRAKN